MPPSVHVFTLDCLRAATFTESVTPFLRTLPLQWTQCYSSGTWTRPSHASLFSGQNPPDHEVTRPNDSLSKDYANLPRTAKESGYTTAIFSENPSFSSQAGFDHYIDTPNDDIHWKLFPSEFSPSRYVDGVSVGEGVTLAREILSRPNRVRNIANAGYATYRELLNHEPAYQHHGDRVFNHLKSYLSRRTGPTLTVTNVLDPHNPYIGTPPEVEESRPQDELEALRVGDDNRIYLLTNEDPPEAVASAYGDWEQFYDGQERVYEEYAQEADRLLKEWRTAQPGRFNDDLIVILGDHGQLFGAEGMVGHHTSLHPHGINVPLAVDPPDAWKTREQTIETPVSIAGVGRALIEVVSGEVETTEQLVSAISTHSQDSNGAVLVCADGPTWSIPSLYESDRFDDTLIEELAVRKVAYIGKDAVDVFRSSWDSEEFELNSYVYSQEGRNPASEPDKTAISSSVEEWLTRLW